MMTLNTMYTVCYKIKTQIEVSIIFGILTSI